jgi:hypothetical protein
MMVGATAAKAAVARKCRRETAFEANDDFMRLNDA